MYMYMQMHRSVHCTNITAKLVTQLHIHVHIIHMYMYVSFFYGCSTRTGCNATQFLTMIYLVVQQDQKI